MIRLSNICVWRAARRIGLLGLLATALSACEAEQSSPPPPRPVSVVTVSSGKLSNAITFSGEIQAKKDVALAFRIGGRVTDRLVAIGDRVTAGQIVARLDPMLEQNALESAKAALEAARGELVRARSAFERQESLMEQGFTTRPRFDQALRALEVAQAQLEAAEAQVDTAQLRLGYTNLYADAPGVVTARNVEAGEVVQPGQSIVQIARDDGRDAVFAVPARWLDTQRGDATILVALADGSGVTAVGRVREVSPLADPTTRTFEVRVGLQSPPDAMRLGSTVVGTLEIPTAAVVAIPSSALTKEGASAAVWIVDPQQMTVSLRPIDVLRFDPDKVIVSQGLQPGEMIVTGGIQALHPGQRVSPLRTSSVRSRAPQRSAAWTTGRDHAAGI